MSAHPDPTNLQPTTERGRIAYTVAEVAAMLGKHPKWALARLLSPAPHEQPAPAAAPAGAGGELS